jgi:hypothetical protein
MKEAIALGNPGNAQANGLQLLQTPSVAVEAIALLRVDPELRRKEADLFNTKWFDYRPFHPVAATFYYAHCYAEATKRFCLMAHDKDRVDKIRIVDPKQIFLTREGNSFTAARQALDKIGCRYEWALNFLVDRYADRGWRGMPRPNQLYAEELMLDIADAWKGECVASLQVSKLDSMRVEEGKPLTHTQRDYVAWLLEQVRARKVDAWRPLSRLVTERLITIEMVEREFGADTTTRVRRITG